MTLRLHFCGEPLLLKQERGWMLPLLLILFLFHGLSMAPSGHFSRGIGPSPALDPRLLPLAEMWPGNPEATTPCHHLTGRLPSFECAHPHGPALPGILSLDLEPLLTSWASWLTASTQTPHGRASHRQSLTGPPPFPPPEDSTPFDCHHSCEP